MLLQSIHIRAEWEDYLRRDQSKINFIITYTITIYLDNKEHFFYIYQKGTEHIQSWEILKGNISLILKENIFHSSKENISQVAKGNTSLTLKENISSWSKGNISQLAKENTSLELRENFSWIKERGDLRFKMGVYILIEQ